MRLADIGLNSRLTYKGPLALYLSYFVLLVLAGSLVALSFRVDSGSMLFLQLLVTGIGAALISFSLILNSTLIERNINPYKWRKNADTYYNDEGIFEYIHNGFAVTTKEGKSLSVRWQDVVRANSGERKLNGHVRIFHIDVYLSGQDFITVDSTMPGFNLFEKRLKENLRHLLNEEPAHPQKSPALTGGVS